ncbi:glycosyltransferase [Nesterenkonia sp. CL21]|uniref:glycosyltransferase family 2 protein n=1 Tax=Nesterenkonia sp. CL21 TaxID=3064894 RepID=UPI002879F8B9|nr:glycosyltransferase [Nesterenkonia sp. CL21]MDS2172880.1 glycosyltransferase [Nesterenkonia sp. CL21]
MSSDDMTAHSPADGPAESPAEGGLSADPLVTAVIPTVGRPSLREAVRSALRQTVPTMPLVVVDDLDALAVVQSRLTGLEYRLVCTAGRQGAGAARNLGVQFAETPWVAFLDDDDDWVAEKAESQIRLSPAASEQDGRRPAEGTVMSCRALLVGASTRAVPERPYRTRLGPDGAVAPGVVGYVLDRSTVRLRRNFLQTSTLLCPRETALDVPWDESLNRHQDWDWLIRLESAGVRIETIPDILVRVQQGSVGSVSRSLDWEGSRAWLDSLLVEVPAAARADFMASVVARGALASRAWSRGIRELISGLRAGAHPAALLVGLSGMAAPRLPVHHG